MKIVDSAQMASIDRRATERFGIPSLVLMENAAIALSEVIGIHYGSAERVALFCGTGQNGGDGFALARHLENRGVTPLVFVVGERSRCRGDAATNLGICERMNVPMGDITDDDSLEEALARAGETDLIVDAIFGTGLNRPPEGLHATLIQGILDLRLPVLAVDIPSGLSGSSSSIREPAVVAEITVTFAQPKWPHVFAPASEYCGEVVVADISIPHAAVESEGIQLALLRRSGVREILPRRAAASHKGSHGHVAIIGGSPGRSGAAVLAARGALRSGAGLVTVVSDPETLKLVHAASMESMSLTFDPVACDFDALVEAMKKMTAIAIGPGLRDDERSYEAVRQLVSRIEQPLVIDASALNAFAGRASELLEGGSARILTPHPGELARLLGRTTDEINEQRVDVVREAARVTGCVVILKGHQTVVADPDGYVSVNPTGNPGMATGGMGDVLTGVIASLLAQRLDPAAAAQAGVFIHGLAGDLAAETGEIGITASDVADRLPAAIREISDEG